MSYDIYIGNGVMEPVEDEEYVTAYSRIVNHKVKYFDLTVQGVERPDAPTFPNDEMTGNSNNRHPGYSQWSEFCEQAGIESLFFNRTDGLMREHPGYQPLEPIHAEIIESALNGYKELHPDAVPGFEAWTWNDDAPEVGYDPILARLIWLDWWVKWALMNCENPGIHNH